MNASKMKRRTKIEIGKLGAAGVLALCGLGLATTPSLAQPVIDPVGTQVCTGTPDGTCWTCNKDATECYKGGQDCIKSDDGKAWTCIPEALTITRQRVVALPTGGATNRTPPVTTKSVVVKTVMLGAAR
jgi:hypothetical protein